MEFNWIKKGLIFDPTNRFDWMNGFAQVPTAILLDNCIRIYFTCRPQKDEHGNSVSLISFIEVSRNDPSKILYVHDKSIISLGQPGSFDEFGVHPGNVIQFKNQTHFYYQGWTREVSVPYFTSLGMASSDDDGITFQKQFEGPIFSRGKNDPYLSNGFYPFIENNQFKMFYASCSQWITTPEGALEPVYHIRFAESDNGIDWRTNGIDLLTKVYKNESAGRPCVIKLSDGYHMWFCYRNVESFRGHVEGAYKIGYAKSKDGIIWERDDSKSGISLSETGWDSEMMAYPYVIRSENKLYLFYNGNEFGKRGFGYAELRLND